MKTKEIIQSEIDETKSKLKAKEDGWENHPAKSQLELDIRNKESLKLKCRIQALEWVMSSN